MNMLTKRIVLSIIVLLLSACAYHPNHYNSYPGNGPITAVPAMVIINSRILITTEDLPPLLGIGVKVGRKAIIIPIIIIIIKTIITTVPSPTKAAVGRTIMETITTALITVARKDIMINQGMSMVAMATAKKMVGINATFLADKLNLKT